MFVPPPEAVAQIRPPAWAARDAMVETGHADAADLERWDRALDRFAELGAGGEACFMVPMYGATGRTPGA